MLGLLFFDGVFIAYPFERADVSNMTVGRLYSDSEVTDGDSNATDGDRYL